MKKLMILTLLMVLFAVLSKSDAHSSVNQELSTILTKLWDLDHGRCYPDTDYSLNLQGYVTGLNWNLADRARRNLFSSFDETSIFSKPTYRAFKVLLDNYATDTAESEADTDVEKREVEQFLTAILETDVMKEAHRFLASKRKISRDVSMFRNLLRNLWFRLYKRLHQDRFINSCGFEHVFIGETRGSEVTGFHNWIQFYLQERSGVLDYRGYFRRGTTEEVEVHPRLMTLQFVWNGTSGKSIGSMFVGTSPEFEMAMYTVSHVFGLTRPVVNVHQYMVELVTYGHGNSIGSAFPRSLSN